MSSLFSTYLQLGFTHITDLEGYDHILFIVALCAIYSLRQWRSVAVLVTAFTIGHSVTLAMAALDVIQVNGPLIELLIPITILLTAIYNVVVHRFDKRSSSNIFSRQFSWNYLFALIFGLIHGMGFSNFLRASLLPGQEDQLVTQLLAFNVGVELGQLAIVGIILGISVLAFQVFKVKQREWNLFVSGAAAGIALLMVLERV
ncbi:MAG: HupE/UreJ family protein [Bacteroidota bacterium]